MGPVINKVVFRHMPLTWEWGLVAGSVVCFVSLVETWKAIKRRMAQARRAQEGGCWKRYGGRQELDGLSRRGVSRLWESDFERVQPFEKSGLRAVGSEKVLHNKHE